MIVGTVKEIKDMEYRVGLTPAGASAYVSAGHRVLVEAGAGIGSGFPDEAYQEAGATRVDTAEEVWNTSQLIIKVKEPVASEYPFLREELMLYTYLHLAADRPLTDALMSSGTTGIAYETITDSTGGLPLLEPMSIIAGRMSAMEGAKYLEKTFGGEGILLSGVPGVEKGKVLIIGGGNVGREACKIAMGLGADVTVMDVNIKKLAYLDDLFGGRIHTIYSTPAHIREILPTVDLVVGAVLIPGRKAPNVITRKDLSSMKPGSVLVDVAVDQGGCFETTHPTTHTDPVFEIDGVIHYCVANMPGAVARTATLALTNATLTPGLTLATLGPKKAMAMDVHLRNGLNTWRGECTCPGVADAFELPLTDAASLF